jgi:hypothetical protein
MIRSGRLASLVVLAFGTGGCGGSSTTGPAQTVLQVGGSYQVTPTLAQNPCGQITVEPGPAQVAHTPGASDFRLTHAGQTYAGHVQSSGAFTTDPLVIPFPNNSTDTVRIEGRFRADGFDATVSVDLAHSGAPPCHYVVNWNAAKQGSPNVIP